MYGLVNKAMQELVTASFGEDTWNDIRREAGFDEEEFVGLKSYPDSLTYDLVRIGSKKLGIPQEVLLEKFGERWISHTAASGYDNVLNLGGSNMIDFLHNLNSIHSKIAHLMPSMQPPVFRIKNEYVTRIELLYFSDRPGFQPMVTGILRGLGIRFGLEVQIKNLGPDADFPQDILFEISW